MYKILIIEDDPGIVSGIKKQLESWNYQVEAVEDFKKVTESFNNFSPDLVLLDILLPFYDGFYWCSRIREISNVPIMFISSVSDNMNIIMAMNMGGDDFIVKPFDNNVLTAKVNALLRRTYDFTNEKEIFEHNGVFLNLDEQTLIYEEETIPLTKNEFGILQILMENKSKVVSREKIMERLWKSEVFIDENTLSVNITRLRKKLDSYGLGDFIKTKFGVGYFLG